MKSDPIPSSLPTEDRAALREELLRTANADHLQVFDALNRAAEQDDDVPEMPDSLRDELVEQFGDRTPRRAALAPREAGFIASVIEFFRARPLAGYGGLAAAACAVMFMMLQTGGVDDPKGKIDTVRGGGDVRPTATADVPVYFFPKSKAAEVVALMDGDRVVEVVESSAEVDALIENKKWAVIVNLEQRVVASLNNGGLSDDVPIEGDGPRGVLLGIRNALDEMVME